MKGKHFKESENLCPACWHTHFGSQEVGRDQGAFLEATYLPWDLALASRDTTLQLVCEQQVFSYNCRQSLIYLCRPELFGLAGSDHVNRTAARQLGTGT